MQEAKTEYSNFITPPDVINESKHNVLVIDATLDEVQQLGLFCTNSPINFNIYLYNYTMNNLDWMALAGDRAHAIIINTEENSFTEIKEKLLDLSFCYYYGPKTYDFSPRKINRPVDYFIEYTKFS